MPWHLEKTEGGYYVTDINGKRYSKKPLPHWRALAQLRAIEVNNAKELTRSKHLQGQHDQSTHGNWASGKRAAGEAHKVYDAEKWAAMDMGTRRDSWNALPQAERDRQADAGRTVPTRQAEILKSAGERPTFEAAGGDVKKGIAMRLKSIDGLVPDESQRAIETTVGGIDDLLSLSGVKPELRHKIAQECIDSLAAQDHESLGRTLGDHGIPHITGNIAFANEMLLANPGEDNFDDMASVALAAVFHDEGYLTPPSEMFLDEGHPRWSQEHFEKNIKPMIAEALGDRKANEIAHMIRTHADTSMDWDQDTPATALRTADNLALFQSEKLPGLFRLVPENVGILQDLHAKKTTVDQARGDMQANIKSSKLSPQVKKQLMQASMELSPVSPKFILGMLGGAVDRFTWSKGHMVVYLKKDARATTLNKLLDLGQRQFAKFAEVYGIDPKQFLSNLNFKLTDPRSGKDLLEAIVIEEKERKWGGGLDLSRRKHLQGQHDQSSHGQRAGSRTVQEGLHDTDLETSQSIEGRHAIYDVRKGNRKYSLIKDRWGAFIGDELVSNWHDTPEEAVREADRFADERLAGQIAREKKEAWLNKFRSGTMDPDKGMTYEDFGKIHQQNFRSTEATDRAARSFLQDLGLKPKEASKIVRSIPYHVSSGGSKLVSIPEVLRGYNAWLKASKAALEPSKEPGPKFEGPQKATGEQLSLFKSALRALTRLKHLPGQHDQETHGDRAGASDGHTVRQPWHAGQLRRQAEARKREQAQAVAKVEEATEAGQRPEWLLPDKAPPHIKNPQKAWAYERLVKKINVINQQVHDLANDFRAKKASGDWASLKKITDQAADLIELRRPMLEELEGQAQIKLPIYVPSFGYIRPMNEKPPEPSSQMGFGFKDGPLVSQMLSWKHLPGQHDQKRHGWRYGSMHAARRVARQGKGNWEEYKRRARSGSTGSKLPDELHDAQIEIGRRLRKIAKIKDPQERMDRLNELEAQQAASSKKHGWMLQSRWIAKAKIQARDEIEAKPKKAPEALGDKTKAFGADPNKSYEFQTKVVSLDSLIPSNTREGGINPDYDPTLQPRDRSRAASQQQIDNIAKNLSPETLIYDFHRLDTGSPIVGDDNMVESGNGRVLAMDKARQLYPERWDAYQQTLKNSLETHGLTEKDIEGIKDPVLVRERVTQANRAEFAKEANQAALLQMSPLEVAIQDAGRIKSETLTHFNVDEDQSIDQALRSPKNQDFVRNFVGSLPDTERGGLMRADGTLNRMGLWRLKAAIFSKVFPGEAGQRISETFLESLDSNIKNFESAISGALPKLAHAEGLIASGRRDKKLSMVGDFSKAIDMLGRLRERGMSIADYLGQQSLFGSELNPRQLRLLNFFGSVGNRPKTLRGFFEKYADAIINSVPTGQSSLFNNLFGGGSGDIDAILTRLITDVTTPAAAPAAVPTGQGGLF